MLKRLHLQNFTVFADAEFAFGPGLNVVVGANGTGKSHVLKLGYAAEAAQEDAVHDKLPPVPTIVADKYGEGIEVKRGGAIIVTLGSTFNIEADFASVIRSSNAEQSADFEVVARSNGQGEGVYNIKINSNTSVTVNSAESRV